MQYVAFWKIDDKIEPENAVTIDESCAMQKPSLWKRKPEHTWNEKNKNQISGNLTSFPLSTTVIAFLHLLKGTVLKITW